MTTQPDRKRTEYYGKGPRAIFHEAHHGGLFADLAEERAELDERKHEENRLKGQADRPMQRLSSTHGSSSDRCATTPTNMTQTTSAWT